MLLRQAKGYRIITDPDPARGFQCIDEADIAQCCHCDRAIEIKPGVDVHRCTCCDSLICQNCVGKGCDPMEEKLRRWETQASFARALRGD